MVDDDDSDESDEEDFVGEEEDDGYEDTKPSKKRRRKKSKPSASVFFEEDVEEDDADYEEEGPGEVAEEKLTEQQIEMNERVDARNRAREVFMNTTDEQIVQKFKERHAHRFFKPADASAGAVEGDLSKIALARSANAPNVSDPILFSVKCKPGSEHRLVIQLMTKFVALRGTEEEVNLISVTDSCTKGYIYIEAINDGMLKSALRGMRDVFMFRVAPLPLKERPDALKVSSTVRPMRKGDYVRMTRESLTRATSPRLSA